MADGTAGAFPRLNAVSGMIAAVGIPLALAIVGQSYSAAIKKREIQGRFVELAVTILSAEPAGDRDRALRGWATRILDKFSGVPMGESARVELQDSIVLPSAQVGSAGALERDAFDLLLNDRVDDAIAAFRAVDAAVPGYHSASEIASLLQAERATLNTPAGQRIIRDRIARDYSWRVPPDIVRRLRGPVPP